MHRASTALGDPATEFSAYRFSSSRSTHTSGVSGGLSLVTCSPFNTNLTIAASPRSLIFEVTLSTSPAIAEGGHLLGPSHRHGRKDSKAK
jgi:hypothetical protein